MFSNFPKSAKSARKFRQQLGKPLKPLFCAVLCLFALTTSSSTYALPTTELVQNGGFESGNLTGWGIGSNAPVSSSLGASSGQFAAVLGFGDFRSVQFQLGQTIATTPGQVYRLGFDWLFSNDGDSQSLLIVATGLDPGLIFRGINSQGHVADAFEHYSFQFTADSLLTNLSFFPTSFPRINHTAQLIDSISVMPCVPVPVDLPGGTPGTNTVPEPGSVALMALGLLGVAVLRRKSAAP